MNNINISAKRIIYRLYLTFSVLLLAITVFGGIFKVLPQSGSIMSSFIAFTPFYWLWLGFSILMIPIIILGRIKKVALLIPLLHLFSFSPYIRYLIFIFRLEQIIFLPFIINFILSLVLLIRSEKATEKSTSNSGQSFNL